MDAGAQRSFCGVSWLHTDPFITLLLIVTLAAVVPVVLRRFRRLHLPVVVGEILAGVIIGRSGLNWVEPSAVLTFLAEFGFVMLMFLSGLEVDFNLLFGSGLSRGREKRGLGSMTVAALIFAGTVGLALLAALFLRRFGVRNPLLMGLILSTTSLGIVVPILKERDMLGTEYGQVLLVAASLADFATLILLTFVIALGSQGLTLDLLLVPVLLAIFFLFARLARRVSRNRLLQRVLDELSSATAQLRVRGAFALMVGWVVLAEAMGVELILGAFLAGAIAGMIAEHDGEDAREKLDAIGFGFFIPIFFIMVGAEFNLQALLVSTEALLLVPLLIGIALLVKMLPSLFLRTRFGWRETLAGGLLLSARLSLIIAAAAIALDLGLISEALNAAIILLAVLTTTFTPMIFNRILPPREGVRREGILLVGQDQLTEFLADRLKDGDEPVVVLCPDASRMEALRKMGVRIVCGENGLEEVLAEAGGETARCLVDLTSTHQETLEVCRLARQRFHIPLVVSRISDVTLLPDLHALGVKVVQPALATAMALEGAIRYPTAFTVLTHTAEDVEVGEGVVRNLLLVGRALKEVRLPGDVLIISLQRDGNVTVPHGETVLQRGDRLGLLGSPEAVDLALALLGD